MSSNSHQTDAILRKMIEKEIRLNGIHFDREAWLSSERVMNECVRALVPEHHEGKSQSFGAIFSENIEEIRSLELIRMDTDQLETARKMADGKEWFILYEKDTFVGLIRLGQSITDELQLMKNYPLGAGLMIQRDEKEVTRFLQGEGIIIHDRRRWFGKPNIKEAAWKISQCVENVDKNILSRILEFSFHLMSPFKGAGGVIVWYLNEPDLVHQKLRHLKLSITNESHARLICHLISQVDGATLVDPSGWVMDTGIHLKFSEKSRELIGEYKGTRHTSSMRYSFDHENILVFTISEDGPVTVFLNGANIANLKLFSPYRKVRDLKKSGVNQDTDIVSHSFILKCKRCGKNSMLEQVNVAGRERLCRYSCATCKSPLYSSKCTSLMGRPYQNIGEDPWHPDCFSDRKNLQRSEP